MHLPLRLSYQMFWCETVSDECSLSFQCLKVLVGMCSLSFDFNQSSYILFCLFKEPAFIGFLSCVSTFHFGDSYSLLFHSLYYFGFNFLFFF